MAYPSTATIKRLFAVSGNICAFAHCPQPLVDAMSGTVTGEICHIKAQNTEGPRYDASQTEQARHGYDNLVLMCSPHHKIIDSDILTYTVDVLEEIKKNHEAKSTKVNTPDDSVIESLLKKLIARVTPEQKNLEYFHNLIKTGTWHQEFISTKELWICEEDNLCQIEVSHDTEDFSEPWTKVYPDQNGSWKSSVYLRVNNVAIKEILFVSCDGGRIFVPMPEVRMKNEVPSYFGTNDHCRSI